jgi:hypothetical protein
VWPTSYPMEGCSVATLLNHAEEIVFEVVDALADKKISVAELGGIAYKCVEAGACVLPRLQDKSQFGALATEAEELYDAIIREWKAADTDGDLIPGVPGFLEPMAISLARRVIRPALEQIMEFIDGVG